MKNLICLSISLLLLTNTLFSQDCTVFFPQEEGVKYEISHYNKKGKFQGATKYEIESVTKSNSGSTLIHVKTVTVDKKKDNAVESHFDAECDDGVYSINITDMLSNSMDEAYKDMDLEISGTGMEFPGTLEVGKELPDASSQMDVKSNGAKLMSMKYNITNRKVEGKESITTPAGTFDAYKISYDFEMDMMFKKKYKSVQWIAEGYGMVRTESLNKKGKVESYSELTSFEK